MNPLFVIGVALVIMCSAAMVYSYFLREPRRPAPASKPAASTPYRTADAPSESPPEQAPAKPPIVVPFGKGPRVIRCPKCDNSMSFAKGHHPRLCSCGVVDKDHFHQLCSLRDDVLDAGCGTRWVQLAREPDAVVTPPPTTETKPEEPKS